MLIMKNGKRYPTEGIERQNWESIKVLSENKKLRYLCICVTAKKPNFPERFRADNQI